jgi:nitroreductase
MMDIQTAIKQRRTIRRFQDKTVDEEVLKELVSLSRLYASGGNLQPIRYAVITKSELLNSVFETLKWAAYLPGFEIKEDERPMAYIVFSCDTNVKKNAQFDLGAAATTLMVAAEGYGLATCCLASFDRAKVFSLLQLPENLEPLLVIALGYPAQKSRAVALKGDVKYFEDEDGCLCVPKRTLEEVMTVY